MKEDWSAIDELNNCVEKRHKTGRYLTQPNSPIITPQIMHAIGQYLMVFDENKRFVVVCRFIHSFLSMARFVMQHMTETNDFGIQSSDASGFISVDMRLNVATVPKSFVEPEL